MDSWKQWRLGSSEAQNMKKQIGLLEAMEAWKLKRTSDTSRSLGGYGGMEIQKMKKSIDRFAHERLILESWRLWRYESSVWQLLEAMETQVVVYLLALCTVAHTPDSGCGDSQHAGRTAVELCPHMASAALSSALR